MTDLHQENFIPIEHLRTLFDYHINKTNNNRILFSGKFGSGKTTFLHSYFDNHEEYEPIYLYPVNYSIATNEDIFELIKYDILLELLSKDFTYDIDVRKISKSISLYEMLTKPNAKVKTALLEAGKDVLKGFAEAIPVIGKSIVDLSDTGWELYKTLKEQHDEFHKTSNENYFDKIEEYRKSFKTQKGSILESDPITEIIIDLVSQLQKKPIDSESEEPEESEKFKKVVLIIDDLDRIDPEHIFRLLNIFSAHVDTNFHTIQGSSYNNKFNFDKILFACDVRNIRSIFSAKYGLDTHFSGYIDKFYSIQIFNFSLSNFAQEVAENALKTFQLRNVRRAGSAENYKNLSLNQALRGSYYESFTYVFTLLVKYDLISVRDLMKLPHKYLELPDEPRLVAYQITKIDQLGILIIDFLRLIYSSDDEIKFILKKAEILYIEQNLIQRNLKDDNTIKFLIGNLCHLMNFIYGYHGTHELQTNGVLYFNNRPYYMTAKAFDASANQVSRYHLSGELSSPPLKSDGDTTTQSSTDVNMPPNIFWYLQECLRLYR